MSAVELWDHFAGDPGAVDDYRDARQGTSGGPEVEEPSPAAEAPLVGRWGVGR